MKFALDTPAERDVDQITRFSGWCLTDAGMPAERVFLRVDGLAAAQLERTPRWDLVAAFPEFPEAAHGGFAGDLVLSERLQKGDCVDVELVASADQSEHVLLRRTFRAGDRFSSRTSWSACRSRTCGSRPAHRV